MQQQQPYQQYYYNFSCITLVPNDKNNVFLDINFVTLLYYLRTSQKNLSILEVSRTSQEKVFPRASLLFSCIMTLLIHL